MSPHLAPNMPLTASELLVAEAVTNWRAALSDLSGGSALWDVRVLGEALVDLTAAHPSGVAQLFAGRPTRLSNLIREGSALAQARRRIRVVAARTDDLAQRYGVAPTYVAMGIATWRTTLSDEVDTAAGTHAAAATVPISQSVMDHEPERPRRETRAVRAPVLLRPVSMNAGGSDSEIDLELDASVELNPVLVRDLQAHGVALDPADIAAATISDDGFSPQAALDAVAALGGALPEFQLERRIVLGAFVHPGQSLAEDLEDLEPRLSGHSLVLGMAGDSAAREQISDHRLPEPAGPDRDPDSEGGVGDLDRTQHHVLDAVAAGAHLLVDTPPGVDVPGTVAATIAQAVTDGDTVLYVPGTRRAAQSLMDRLRALGLEDLALDLAGGSVPRSRAMQRVIEGLNPPEPDEDSEQLRADRAELVEVRGGLDGFVAALHRRREPWQASAYEALQALAGLTSQRPGPRTRVQLTGEVVTLDEDGRVQAREALARAAALGAFRLRAADTPWFGAELHSAEHALSTLDKVRTLSGLMPTLLEQVEATSAQTGLDQATTFTGWGDQLRLLTGIRTSLEYFTSQIFERSAKQMAAATAPRSWRAERNIDLTWSERRRLRRQAKDLIRPGVSVPDLHSELLDVERRREQWRRACSGGAWPHLPEGLGRSLDTHARVSELLADLNDVLSPTLAGQDLADVPLPDLAVRLERLGADDDSVRQMPERAAALSVLNSLGLGELVTDLTTRRVPTELVGAEFELAWWSSVLEEMLTADPALSGIDANGLEEMTARLRRLDPAHQHGLTIPVRRALRRRVRAAIEADRQRAQNMYRDARAGGAELKEMLAKYGAVAREPRPVWLVPPMVVPTVLDTSQSVDLLILDAVQHLPVEHAISAIARAKQVVVFGDPRRGGSGVVQALSWLPSITLSGHRADQEPEIAAFLAAHGYADVVQPVPAPPRPSPVGLELVEGSGMPAPDSAVVESVQAEVDRVVDLVIDHALTRPEESLAVIALNTRHADRLREAVAATAQGSRALEDFFDPTRAEAFTVGEVEAVAGLRRDAVILSLGYGKTPHGRVLHRFGSVGGPDGQSYLIDALDAVRHRLTVVSCFGAEELDPHRLRTAGAQMLRELLQFARDGVAAGQQEQADYTPDPLLNDLTARLRRRGLRVVPRYGKPGGVRIPLAVGHPALPGELVLAVLSDDATYVAEPSLRVRERHWVQRLQDRGWHVHMVYSPVVFMDPQTVADQIAAQVSDIVTERSGQRMPEAPAGLPPRVEHDDDSLVTTNATLSAIRGEQIAGAQDVALIDVAPIAGERSARPPVEAGRPLGDYGDNELDALLTWIGSDDQPRTAEELRTELAAALGLKRRSKRATAILGNAVRRSGLAVETPASPPEPEDDEAADGGGSPTEGAVPDGDTSPQRGGGGSPGAVPDAATSPSDSAAPDAATSPAEGVPPAASVALPDSAPSPDSASSSGSAPSPGSAAMPSADSPASAPSEAAESAEQVPTQGRLDLEETGAQSTDEDDGGREAGKPEERPRDDAREIDETAAPSRRSLRYRWKPVLPDRAREDDPRAWGERSEDDDDRFLTNRPPHWG